MPKYAVTDRYRNLVGVAMEEQSPPKQLAIPPEPLAEWDFAQTAAPFLSTEADLPLTSSGPSLVRRTISPWGFAGHFPSTNGYLKLAAASIERLNIGAAGGNEVSIAAWINVDDTDIGFVAGCWQEDTGDPRRQYGLFYDLNLYGGDNRVCMHVSKTGGASPGIPFSRDYAASPETFTRGSWYFFVGTYDGAQAIAYLNGKGTSYLNFTEPGPPNGQGLTYDKNPYLFPLGLNDTPCDFTVGACKLTSAVSHYVWGRIAKLRVWDRMLTPQEVQTLYKAEVGAVATEGFRQATASGTDGTSFTFPAQPIGEPSATRRVVVSLGWGGASAATLSSVTIGGVAATIDVDSGALTGNRRQVLASAVVPTGTTADVVATLSGTVGRMGIGVWALPAGTPTGQTAVVADQASGTLSVTVTAGDLVIAAGYSTKVSGTTTTTWTGAIERFDQATENTFDSTTGADTVAKTSTATTDIGFSTDGTTGRGYVAAAYSFS